MNFSVSILLCACAFLASCTANPRIIGGQNANIQDYPYQISMRYTFAYLQKPMHFCGGSIVSKNHIVTAAHCVENKQDMLKNVKVFTGTSRSDTGTAHTIKSVTVHPGYRGPSNFYLNDIAIVTLNEPIAFDQFHKAVKLPTKDIQNGADAIVTGWGDTSAPQGETPLNLQKANVRLMGSTQCQRQLPYTMQYTQVCATQTFGVGVCSGDSGGPLTIDGELIGIASYVVQCAKGYPDVYTNVYHFTSFIKQTIGSS